MKMIFKRDDDFFDKFFYLFLHQDDENIKNRESLNYQLGIEANQTTRSNIWTDPIRIMGYDRSQYIKRL